MVNWALQLPRVYSCYFSLKYIATRDCYGGNGTVFNEALDVGRFTINFKIFQFAYHLIWFLKEFSITDCTITVFYYLVHTVHCCKVKLIYK